MGRWLLMALVGAGLLGWQHWQSRGVGATGTTAVTVYALSAKTCALEQQKADRLVAELAAAGINYTLHYVDRDVAAQGQLGEKVSQFLQKQGSTGNVQLRFPVLAVRETLLFDAPSLAQIQKHR
ncbi:MAG: hypothetical protein Q6K81_02805 [Gloeomargarita sp. DG02_5_bins_242]